MRYVILILIAAGGGALASCGDSTGLLVTSTNVVDTVSLYALTGTPVTTPSAYSFSSRGVVRTDLAATFDFAFDIDTAGRPVLLPTGAMKLGQLSGLQVVAQRFDSIRMAPTTGYHLDSAVVVNDSSVVLAHSVPLPCSNITAQEVLYAKLHILALDTTSAPNGRRIDFEILVNFNCGFRSLEPGTPKN